VAGALDKAAYLEAIRTAGFPNVEVKSERAIHLPDQLLLRFIDRATLDAFREQGAVVWSVTMAGEATDK